MNAVQPSLTDFCNVIIYYRCNQSSGECECSDSWALPSCNTCQSGTLCNKRLGQCRCRISKNFDLQSLIVISIELTGKSSSVFPSSIVAIVCCAVFVILIIILVIVLRCRQERISNTTRYRKCCRTLNKQRQ